MSVIKSNSLGYENIKIEDIIIDICKLKKDNALRYIFNISKLIENNRDKMDSLINIPSLSILTQFILIYKGINEENQEELTLNKLKILCAKINGLHLNLRSFLYGSNGEKIIKENRVFSMYLKMIFQQFPLEKDILSGTVRVYLLFNGYIEKKYNLKNSKELTLKTYFNKAYNFDIIKAIEFSLALYSFVKSKENTINKTFLNQ